MGFNSGFKGLMFRMGIFGVAAHPDLFNYVTDNLTYVNSVMRVPCSVESSMNYLFFNFHSTRCTVFLT